MLDFFKRKDKTPASVKEIREALQQAEAEAAASKTEAEGLDAARRDVLLVGEDDELDAHDAKTASAWRRHERANAALDELKRRLEDAVAREEDHARRDRYEAAKRCGDEMATRFRLEYPELASKIVELMRGLAEAELAIAEANKSLPTGADPLSPAEVLARGLPGEKRETIDTEAAGTRWHFAQSGNAVDEQLQSLVKPNEDGRTGWFKRTHSPDWEPVVLKSIQRVHILEGRAPAMAETLCSSLSLPEARVGGAPYWRPAGKPLAFASQPGSDAQDILKRIDDLQAARQKPANDPRSPRQRAVTVQVVNGSEASK